MQHDDASNNVQADAVMEIASDAIICCLKLFFCVSNATQRASIALPMSLKFRESLFDVKKKDLPRIGHSMNLCNSKDTHAKKGVVVS